MRDVEREQLKSALRSKLDSKHHIDLSTKFHWAIHGIKSPDSFFNCLPQLLPNDAILYIEGADITAEAAIFYEQNLVLNPIDVVQDILFPAPKIYHVQFSQELSDCFKRLLSKYESDFLFNHIKAYKEKSIIFTFHDAFSGILRISDFVPESIVSDFCASLGVSYSYEKTNIPDTASIAALLRRLNNP